MTDDLLFPDAATVSGFLYQALAGLGGNGKLLLILLFQSLGGSLGTAGSIIQVIDLLLTVCQYITVKIKQQRHIELFVIIHLNHL